MRTLRFVVDGQIITKDPECDFNNLVPGTEEYLKAEFSFSSEWDGCTKVAEFTSGGKEYTPQPLTLGRVCVIPGDILKRSVFNIKILGKKGTLRLTTNDVAVSQDGGKK